MQVTDPETKRKVIGHTFIEVFEQEAKQVGDAEFLLQGTLYPDVIESISFKGTPTPAFSAWKHAPNTPLTPCCPAVLPSPACPSTGPSATIKTHHVRAAP